MMKTKTKNQQVFFMKSCSENAQTSRIFWTKNVRQAIWLIRGHWQSLIYFCLINSEKPQIFQDRIDWSSLDSTNQLRVEIGYRPEYNRKTIDRATDFIGTKHFIRVSEQTEVFKVQLIQFEYGIPLDSGKIVVRPTWTSALNKDQFFKRSHILWPFIK